MKSSLGWPTLKKKLHQVREKWKLIAKKENKKVYFEKLLILLEGNWLLLQKTLNIKHNMFSIRWLEYSIVKGTNNSQLLQSLL